MKQIKALNGMERALKTRLAFGEKHYGWDITGCSFCEFLACEECPFGDPGCLATILNAGYDPHRIPIKDMLSYVKTLKELYDIKN